MIQVQNIINSIVKEHEFVVLPEFGAILGHQIPASFDSIKGKFSPASRKLSFNESLKQDDGFLANYISKTKSITHQEASIYLKKYVQTLKLEIQNIGSTEIKGVGVFQKNIEGKLLFEPDFYQSIKDDWYGFTDITAKLVNPANRGFVINSTVEEVKHVFGEEDNKVIAINWYKWSAAAMIVGAFTYFSYFLVTNDGTLNKSNLNPIGFFNENFKKQPNNIDFSTREVLKSSKPEFSVNISTSVDSTSEILAPTYKREIETETIAESSVEDNNFKYYLIAGAFKGEKQALKLKDIMIQKGYNSCIVIPADEFSSKYKVAVKGFLSKEEANTHNSDLKKAIGEHGWVYTNRK